MFTHTCLCVLAMILGTFGWAQPTPPAAPAAPKENAAVRPVDRQDAWWQERHAGFNKRAAQGAERGDINVVFLGDSITEGWGGAGKETWEKTFAPMGAVNFGIGGDQTQHVIWRLDHGNVEGLAKPKAGAAPKLVVLMIGTNNSGSNTPEEIAAGVAGVVAKLKEKLPATKVLLLAIFPRSAGPDALRTKILETNKLIAKLDDGKGVEYFDFGNRFLEIDGTLSKEIMPDALHLSPKGYQIWAEAIEAKVRAATN